MQRQRQDVQPRRRARVGVALQRRQRRVQLAAAGGADVACQIHCRLLCYPGAARLGGRIAAAAE
jgi:hypothetical protein